MEQQQQQPPHTQIDLDPEQHSTIDGTLLTKIVKQRDLGLLLDCGGVPGIASSLHKDYEGGILGDETDLSTRRNTFGTNTCIRPPTRSLLGFVWEAFKDPTIIILLVCGLLSLGFGIRENGLKEGWYDGGSIFVAIFLVITISAANNYRQSRQFDSLANESSDVIMVDVVRRGRRQHIPIPDVVVGDVICLKIGDQVPVDGLLLDGHSLQVDESCMTGESDPVDVDSTRSPFLTSGTKVADGYGRMIATSVGMSTSWGELMSSVIRDDFDEETPLQTRLNKLTPAFGKVGLTVAVMVLLVLLIRYFTGHTKERYRAGSVKPNDVMNAVVKMVAAAVTIVVIAIPEGLPMAVKLTLAYSMKRMMGDNAMVRKLSACETMGSATVICTDKTGTLTMNQMKVTVFWVGQEQLIDMDVSRIEKSVVELIHQGVGLNTTGSVYMDSEYEFFGSPTEKAILSWAVLDLKMDPKVIESCEIVSVKAFNSQEKRSGVVLRCKAEGTTHAHWKGAAEMVLAMCSSFYEASGAKKDIDDDTRMKFEEIIRSMAACSLRCIGFAHAQVGEEADFKEEGLTLLGLVGLKDPCRAGVKKAVQECQNAGVSIKMITGDNVFTAKAIATECGILGPAEEGLSGAVIEGAEFRECTEEERMEMVDNIRVMARSSPFDKLLMVQCLKKKGHVVAVTGDGTNDAPALKEANIGLSMGMQGTEVAKESSDIVILDDNFATVATVLGWGRCVYNNIQKFIQFQLTVTFSALVINFIAAVSVGSVPLTTVQILWVNLIQDTLGALALATDKPTRELMEVPPVGRTEPIITNVMWRNLLAQAGYQTLLLLVLQFKGEAIFKVDTAVNDTLMFNSFVLCQSFNAFNARKLEKKNVFQGVYKNKLFLGIIGLTLVLQVMMVALLNRFADTVRLGVGQWGACLGIAAVSLPIAWVVKFIPVPEKPIFSYIQGSK